MLPFKYHLLRAVNHFYPDLNLDESYNGILRDDKIEEGKKEGGEGEKAGRVEQENKSCIDFFHSGKKANNHWGSEQNRRVFFESLAKAKNVDPLVPETWYSKFTRSEIRDAKVNSVPPSPFLFLTKS